MFVIVYLLIYINFSQTLGERHTGNTSVNYAVKGLERDIDLKCKLLTCLIVSY